MITLPTHRYLTPLLIGILILLSLHLLSLTNSSLSSSTPTYQSPKHIGLNPPPPEYHTAYPSDPDPTCEANHGLPYLQHIAQNHIPYCEPAYSRSGFECFKTIHQDLICVASGVQYTALPPTSPTDNEGNISPAEAQAHKPFSMHCKMRNLTLERLEHPERIPELEGYRSREMIKEYMYNTGIPFQLQAWKDGEGSKCNARNNDGSISVLVRREGTGNIWHRLLEMWQVKLSLDAIGMSGFIPGWDVGKVRVVFEDDDKGPWDELLWPMITGQKPIRKSELQDGCLGTVILPLVGATSPFWWGVWEDLPCRETFLFEPFMKKALGYMGLDTPPRLTQDTAVTIVNRTGTSNTRQLWNIDSHAEALRKSFPGVTVRVLDFSTIELKEQIRIIRDTDVLLGAMGAGLTHLFFMNGESAVAEVLAPGAHYTGFRNLAKVRGIPYFVTHGVEEGEFVASEEWRRVSGVKDDTTPAVVEGVAATDAVEADGNVGDIQPHSREIG